MNDNQDETNDSKRYVGRVQEEVQRYLREVLDDNNALRLLLANARTENLELTGEVERLRAESERHQGMQVHLREQLMEIETASARYAAQYSQVEQQNSNLANLYVASYQLAGTVDRDAVLQAIQEIVANLIGSEEIGIYEMNEARTQLVLAASFGIDAVRMARIDVGRGTIGAAASTGELYVSPTNGPDADNLTACIPLRVDGTVIGAVVIFGLLAHKPVLNDVDREMFDLLAVHAATSLYCANLHARVGALA